MTDLSSSTAQAADLHTSKAARDRLAARYRKEATFKYLGMGAVGLAVLFLVILLSTIVGKAYLAFTYHYVNLPVTLDQAAIDPDNTGDPEVIGRADFGAIAKSAMKDLLPFANSRRDRRVRNALLTSDAGIQLRAAVMADPSLIGKEVKIPVQLDDVGDLYLKDQVSPREITKVTGIGSPTGTEGTIKILSTANDFSVISESTNERLSQDADAQRLIVSSKGRSRDQLQARIDGFTEQLSAAPEDGKTRLQSLLDRTQSALDGVKQEIATAEAAIKTIEAKIAAPALSKPTSDRAASFFVRINGGLVKVTKVATTEIEGEVLVPLRNTENAEPGEWQIESLTKPESNRKLTDKEVAWIDYMVGQDLVERKFNSVFFTAGASREPEQAGILGAVMGSLYTMLVTLMLSFPIGVAAAIYLEEFAPKNRFTEIIEININNLAAVPSIVFGLLGLAMFLNVFELPRSAPLVGGMVLALMTLPTIIIAARAALRSVPPSIREAALGVGASKLQTITHHVLPLAMPGILTGTIIGMAQALGETAPLLMIGMVAFIVDVPSGPFDPATVLPVQIFMWADFPEPAFQQKTSAAILVLLGFLVLMNAIAVILRKRFERRW